MPLWIREGLEKMEREKQRQMEKERHEQAMQDAKKAREEAQKEGVDQDDPQAVVKSIFVNHSLFTVHSVNFIKRLFQMSKQRRQS